VVGERIGEPLGGVIAAPEAAVAIGRDECEHRVAGMRKTDGHDGGRIVGESPQAALLPAGDEQPHRALVGDGSPCSCEGEPPAGALPAASNGPRRRRAATLAERRRKRRQGRVALRAELLSGRVADETALRQEQVEHGSTLALQVLRDCGGLRAGERLGFDAHRVELRESLAPRVGRA